MINACQMKGEEIDIRDFAASYQHHIATELVKNTIKAVKSTGIKKVCLAGGVSANTFLRNLIDAEAKKNGFEVFYPDLKLCTDNAAMIACAGYYEYMAGTRHGLDLNAMPNLKLGERI